MQTTDLLPLRTLLAPLSPEARRTFACACARRALEALPDDGHRGALRAVLADAATAATAAARQTVLGHPWATRASGAARYLAWQTAYWATWPAALSTWAAESAAWYSQHAVAEVAAATGPFTRAAAAEAAWQRAHLLGPSPPIIGAVSESEGHR